MGSSWCGSAGRGAIAWAQVVGQNSTPIASPLAIAVGAGNAFEPDVSCDGSGCLVVWRDDAGAISARRVDPESSMLVGDELTLSSAGGARPEIENGAGVHLVLFGSENALRGLRVAPDGTAPTFCWRGRPRRRATAGRCATLLRPDGVVITEATTIATTVASPPRELHYWGWLSVLALALWRRRK